MKGKSESEICAVLQGWQFQVDLLFFCIMLSLSLLVAWHISRHERLGVDEVHAWPAGSQLPKSCHVVSENNSFRLSKMKFFFFGEAIQKDLFSHTTNRCLIITFHLCFLVQIPSQVVAVWPGMVVPARWRCCSSTAKVKKEMRKFCASA